MAEETEMYTDTQKHIHIYACIYMYMQFIWGMTEKRKHIYTDAIKAYTMHLYIDALFS